MNSVRFSAAQVVFHSQPCPSKNIDLAQKDDLRVWADLKSIEDLLKEDPFRQQLDKLDAQVKIDFYPDVVDSVPNERGQRRSLPTEVAQISIVDEEGNVKRHPDKVTVRRELSYWFGWLDELQSLRKFAGRVLETAKVVDGAAKMQP